MQTVFLLFIACALSGIAIPMPEDVALLAAGATLEDPWLFAGMVVAAALGLLIRDSFFFLLGHFVGEGVFNWGVVRRLIGEQRIERGRALVEQKGGKAVLISRFMVGVRATGFLASGALGVRVRDFFFWDSVGLLISVPLLLILGFSLGDPILATMTWVLENKLVVVGVAVLCALLWYASTRLWPGQPEPVGNDD